MDNTQRLMSSEVTFMKNYNLQPAKGLFWIMLVNVWSIFLILKTVWLTIVITIKSPLMLRYLKKKLKKRLQEPKMMQTEKELQGKQRLCKHHRQMKKRPLPIQRRLKKMFPPHPRQLKFSQRLGLIQAYRDCRSEWPRILLTMPFPSQCPKRRPRYLGQKICGDLVYSLDALNACHLPLRVC